MVKVNLFGSGCDNHSLLVFHIYLDYQAIVAPQGSFSIVQVFGSGYDNHSLLFFFIFSWKRYLCNYLSLRCLFIWYSQLLPQVHLSDLHFLNKGRLLLQRNMALMDVMLEKMAVLLPTSQGTIISYLVLNFNYAFDALDCLLFQL